jgi:hypothetical protein
LGGDAHSYVAASFSPSPLVLDSDGNPSPMAKNGDIPLKLGRYYIPVVEPLVSFQLRERMGNRMGACVFSLGYVALRSTKGLVEKTYEILQTHFTRRKAYNIRQKLRIARLDEKNREGIQELAALEKRTQKLQEKIKVLEGRAKSAEGLHAHLREVIAGLKELGSCLHKRLAEFEDQQGKPDLRCSICKEHALTTALFPCMHLSFCSDCAQGIVERREECPVCGRQVLHHETFFIK